MGCLARATIVCIALAVLLWAAAFSPGAGDTGLLAAGLAMLFFALSLVLGVLLAVAAGRRRSLSNRQLRDAETAIADSLRILAYSLLQGSALRAPGEYASDDAVLLAAESLAAGMSKLGVRVADVGSHLTKEFLALRIYVSTRDVDRALSVLAGFSDGPASTSDKGDRARATAFAFQLAESARLV